MVKVDDTERLLTLASEFETLIDSDPLEEEVHQFINDNHDVLGLNRRMHVGVRSMAGLLSKFPVAPDRIPDFALFELWFQQTQSRSALNFVELKRPSAQLFVQHGRMSKDLNDAWMESLDTLRLMATSFHDVLRRLVNDTSKVALAGFDEFYSELLQQGTEEMNHIHDVPMCGCTILIGRRGSLQHEGLMRTRELTASTGRTVRVLTYDYLLDHLRNAAEREYLYPIA